MKNHIEEIIDIVKVALQKDSIDASTQEIAKLIKLRLPKEISLPTPGETGAIAIGQEKLAALYYDRVWSGLTDDVPDTVSLWGGTKKEVRLMSYALLEYVLLEAMKKTDEARKSLLQVRIVKALELAPQKSLSIDQLRLTVKSSDLGDMPTSRFIATDLWVTHSLSVPTIYSAISDQASEYTTGDSRVIMTCISNIAIPDKTKLSWPQVLEFRKDTNSRRKYKHFIHWLDKEMFGKPASFIEDEVFRRLERYEWSLRKHGIRTVTGALSSMLDHKTLLTTIASGTALTIAGGELAGLIGAVGSLAARCAIKVTESLVDLHNVKIGENSEVAFVYEVKKRFG